MWIHSLRRKNDCKDFRSRIGLLTTFTAQVAVAFAMWNVLRRLTDLGHFGTQSAVAPKVESKIWEKFLVDPPTWSGFYPDGKMQMLIELLPQINRECLIEKQSLTIVHQTVCVE